MGRDPTSMPSGDDGRSPEPRVLASLPGTRAWQIRVLLVALLFASLHIAFTWSRIDSFLWRDVGRWLHEVERYAGGELPYRDFSWQFPPLAMWLLGSIARVFGSNVDVIWIATSCVYVTLCIVFVRYAQRILWPRAVLPVVVAGLLLSAAFANIQSAPLPLGMYNPAAPIGFLLVASAAIMVLDAIADRSTPRALAGGVLAGLAILTKQDFWIPALYLVAAGMVMMVHRRDANGRREALLLAGGLLATLIAGLTIVAWSTGWTALPDIALGYGSAVMFAGRGLPSWERLATEGVVLCAIGFLVSLVLAAAGVLRGRKSALVPLCFLGSVVAGVAVHVLMDFRQGGGAMSNAASILDSRALSADLRGVSSESLVDLLPTILPFALALVIAWRWKHFEDPRRRRALVFLVGLLIAARARRAFEYAEWYHFLLGLPVYVLAAGLLAPAVRRPDRRWAVPAFALVMLLGMYSYWRLCTGPLTRENRLVAIHTPRGTVRVDPEIARQYRDLAASLRIADPTGRRPLFVFGYASANYFLDRHNPSRITTGFRFTNEEPVDVVDDVLNAHPAPLVLDNLYFTRGDLPIPRLSLTTWRQPMEPSFYRSYDRPIFLTLLDQCDGPLATVPDHFGRPLFRLYDCHESYPAWPPNAALETTADRSR
jgi:hypothetical protein